MKILWRLLLLLVLIGSILSPVIPLFHLPQYVWANPASFSDNFSSFDNVTWGVSTAGAGSVNVSAGKLVIDSSSLASDAAIAYLKTKVDRTKRQLYELGYVLMSPGTGSHVAFRLMDFGPSTPAVGTFAAVSPSVRVQMLVSNLADTAWPFSISYQDSSGVYQYWTGSAWSTNYTTVEDLSDNDEYYFYLETDNISSSWRVMATNSSKGRWVALTDWVTFAELKAPTDDMYIVIGDVWTDYHTSTTTMDYFNYYDGRTNVAFFGSALSGLTPLPHSLL